MNATTMPTTMRCLAVLAACAPCSPAARASGVWASADLTTRSLGVGGGFGLISPPLLGTLGLEGRLERSYGGQDPRFSVAATWRDLHLPGAPLNVFASVGTTLGGGSGAFVEGGLRADLAGPLGLRLSVRRGAGGELSAGLGAEVRF